MATPGWQPLIVCNNPPDFPQACGWADLMTLAQNLITNLIVISTFLAVIVFAYAGFILVTSGGNSSAKDRAKDMLMKVLWGYMWILAAWLVVYTITNTLLKSGYTLLNLQ